MERPDAPGQEPTEDSPPSPGLEDGPQAGRRVSDAPDERGRGIVERLPWWTVPAILLGVPLLAWGAVQVDPDVYDDVVWKYYWGPIKADALPGDFQCSKGELVAGPVPSCTEGGVLAQSGYNVVNTVSWMVLLGVAILGTAQMLQRLRTPMDAKLILAASGWVVAGSVFHVMQDVDLFAPPLEYVFITPPIYLLFAAFGILAFLVGHYAKWVATAAGREVALQKLWMILAIVVLADVALWAQGWDQITHVPNPLWFTALLGATFLVIRARTLRHGVDPSEICGWLSLPAIAFSLVHLGGFVRGAWGAGPEPDAVTSVWIWSTAGALAVVLAVRSLASRGQGAFAMALRQPINLAIVFAHTLDGLATAIGIDHIGGYQEKHVVSEWVRVTFERFAGNIGWELGAANATFLAFLPLKILLGLVVVYGIDVSARDDQRRYPVVMGLMKFAIIMVGLGPGIRNMVRMSLGV